MSQELDVLGKKAGDQVLLSLLMAVLAITTLAILIVIEKSIAVFIGLIVFFLFSVLAVIFLILSYRKRLAMLDLLNTALVKTRRENENLREEKAELEQELNKTKERLELFLSQARNKDRRVPGNWRDEIIFHP